MIKIIGRCKTEDVLKKLDGYGVTLVSELTTGEHLPDNRKLIFNCNIHGDFEISVRGFKGKRKHICSRCSYQQAADTQVGIKSVVIGEVFTCGRGSKVKVVCVPETKRDRYVTVGYKTDKGCIEYFKVEIGGLKRSFKNPYHPHVVDRGFTGVGIYDSLYPKGAKNRWRKMLLRCYDTKTLEKSPTYEGCTVCDEWFDFQNYARWYETTLISDGEDFHVDKDILYRGNKVYSPETCCIVPRELNGLLTLRGNDRGDYPLGVYYKKKNNKFCVQCKDGASSSQTYLGLYNTIEEALEVYIEFKNKTIKEQANRFRHVLTTECYNTLMEIDIRDVILEESVNE